MDDVKLKVLGEFTVTVDGQAAQLPLGAQRLVASLGLADAGVHRTLAAEKLWPDCPRRRACANLRSALWHVRRETQSTLIDGGGGPRLRLAPSVQVDIKVALGQVQTIARTPHVRDEDLAQLESLVMALSRGLLADWSEDWLLVERERWDQVRLHTLEAVAHRLLSAKSYLPALSAALAAVAIEPLRESAHRTVVEVYIAEGNSACALKHFQRYRGLVQRELGVNPSRHMTQLVHSVAST
jgi:DNA-binding SARP family transcriptional activator